MVAPSIQSVELNMYYIKGKNSIVAAPADNRAGWQYMNTGELENYGAEFSADYRINGNLTVFANYSYLHMKREIAASPEHKAYIGADYSVNRWLFSTGLQYVHNLVTEAADPVAGTPVEKESFLLWNARVSFTAAKWLTLYLRGENLLNSKYSMYKGYPMPGATVFGGITVNF